MCLALGVKRQPCSPVAILQSAASCASQSRCENLEVIVRYTNYPRRLLGVNSCFERERKCASQKSTQSWWQTARVTPCPPRKQGGCHNWRQLMLLCTLSVLMEGAKLLLVPRHVGAGRVHSLVARVAQFQRRCSLESPFVVSC